MKNLVISMWAAGVLLGVAGCAYNPVVGDEGSDSREYFGDVGIVGDNRELTIQKNSRVPKISIIGNNNRVTVNEGALVRRIEFWGKYNVVSLPYGLSVRVNEVGTNQVFQRPREVSEVPPVPASTYEPMGPLPDVAPLPPQQEPEEEMEIEIVPVEEPDEDEAVG